MAMAMEQLQGSSPPSFGIGADAGGGGGGGDKGRSRMDGSGSSSRKNKRRSNAIVASVKGKRASKDQGGDAKVEEEAAETAGYIHVRARRGQATDSHSVAERLRREKVNEEMKMLQSLVPGCEKLAGKALLDEIIGYVQSLQNQVEFLSKKLAFLNPRMLHELGLDIGSACHPHAPQVLRTEEMRPNEEPVQWMVPATAAASLAAEAQGVVWGATGLAQDGSSCSVSMNAMQMQLQVQQEEEEMSMGFFQQ